MKSGIIYVDTPKNIRLTVDPILFLPVSVSTSVYDDLRVCFSVSRKHFRVYDPENSSIRKVTAQILSHWHPFVDLKLSYGIVY